MRATIITSILQMKGRRHRSLNSQQTADSGFKPSKPTYLSKVKFKCLMIFSIFPQPRSAIEAEENWQEISEEYLEGSFSFQISI